MFDTNHLVDSSEYDMNCHDLIDTYDSIRHPFGCGNYEAAELRAEDIREQKRMIFKNVLPLKV